MTVLLFSQVGKGKRGSEIKREIRNEKGRKRRNANVEREDEGKV